jgi:hypothetical protein
VSIAYSYPEALIFSRPSLTDLAEDALNLPRDSNVSGIFRAIELIHCRMWPIKGLGMLDDIQSCGRTINQLIGG